MQLRTGAAAMVNEPRLPTTIQQVIDRFPGGRPTDVIRRFLESESFRALCEDYELATTTLQRLETVERTQVESRIAEYRSLIRDLEKEIAGELGIAGEPPR
jgi:hypothetical protein